MAVSVKVDFFEVDLPPSYPTTRSGHPRLTSGVRLTGNFRPQRGGGEPGAAGSGTGRTPPGSGRGGKIVARSPSEW